MRILNPKQEGMKKVTLLLCLLCLLTNTFAKENRKKWKLSHDRQGVTLHCEGEPILKKVTSEFKVGQRLMSTANYGIPTVKKKKINDRFGRGQMITLTYADKTNPTLLQSFRIYDQYVLVDVELKGHGTISTNYIAPVVSHSTGAFIRSGSHRTAFVPFDNDAWIRYHSSQGPVDSLRSYEVTTVYNPISRAGFVIGAINHDVWKNAIDIDTKSSVLTAFSGVADKLTRDHKEHGVVTGTAVKSATFMIGLFSDWRNGMETYGDINALMAPTRAWDKAVPVGWNSWGALAFKVNHENSCEVSQFIADSLQSQSFHNSEGLVYTGLDSGWNSFSDEELTDFARQCKLRNQVPCIYWTPFTDWGKNGDAHVYGSDHLTYKDIWLYANGKPQELDGAYAIDPTHPAVRRMMELTAERFRRYGYKYVKMDFMTHGRMEADRWYNKNISTGTQAYNYGMHLLDSIFSDMYINLSISPIFPAQYAQSRRIACDAWNKIKDTEYTLNALSWGWWIGWVYDYNDADHVVLRDAEEGENRARVTSSVITGIFITGDDFSKSGSADVKQRAMRFLTNPDINRIADGRAFRPLNGDSDSSENIFVRQEQDGSFYLACFNYGSDATTYHVNPYQLGVKDFSECNITELWEHEAVSDLYNMLIPARDVKVFYLKKK
ncbi:hypothetical protein HMPREF1870_02373 [Bacteroidales bacterium KA00344]|nr:hypothetical protein HMPREF1870_02373 [Bacteroidales bacterium KA00344]